MNGLKNASERSKPLRRRPDGKPWRQIVAAALAALAAAAAEELPEKAAYVEMLRADRAREAGDRQTAVAGYQKALTMFERLRRERPDYKAAIVEYRMEYCRGRIADLLKQSVADKVPEPPVGTSASRLGELQAAVQQLENERRMWAEEKKAISRERDAAVAQASRLEREAKTAADRIEAAERRARELEARLAEFRDSVPADQANAWREEARKASEEAARLARRVETIERAVTEARESASADETRIAELSARLAESARQLDRSERDVSALRMALGRTEARAESLAARLAAAQEELAARTDSSVGVAGDDRRLEELARAAAVANRERDRALARAEQLAADLAAAEAARRDDRERIRELGRAMKEASERAGETATLREQLAQATAALHAAEERARAAEHQAHEAAAARRELERRLEQLESPDAIAARGKAMETQVFRLEAQLQAVAAKLDLRDRQARAAEEEVRDLKRELARLQQERESPPTPPGPEATRRSAPASAPAEPPMELRSLLVEAAAALASNDVDRAIHLYDRAVEMAPADPDALLGFGRSHLAKAGLRYARAAAERLVSLYPDMAAGHHLLGLVEAREGNRRSAVRALERAVAADPSQPIYHRDLAIALYKLQRLDEAVAEFREVIRLAPNDGQSHYNLAALLMMSRSPPVEEARALYQRAIALGEPPDAALEKRLQP